ncbi:MAG: hypothetical protein BLITH_1067 [Brockia lithotrophica]|uniref:Stage VI sporulation protein D N-terminal domain-containing protein n=1 Tax=Brockia lithotrophica TaxID=933949 RepID=A0A2T5G7D6_9BACL|nr:hypothetical protein [Brockia lithotrophica]PTQ52100.1 MAG: hypothetical protein BLITH_1067 [Brockia lithotrophica]
MGGERPVWETARGSGWRQIGERMSDRERLSFELVERIALDEPLENEAQILGAELVPDVRIEEDERHVRIVGSLRFTAEYRTSPRAPQGAGELSAEEAVKEGAPSPTRHLVYRIPLDISVPRERVSGEGLLLEIRSLEVELLGREKLLLSTVLELGGIATSPEGEVIPVVDTGYAFEATGFWPFADEPSETKEGEPDPLGDDPALAALAYSPSDAASSGPDLPPETEAFAQTHEASPSASSPRLGPASHAPLESPSPPSPQEDPLLALSPQEVPPPAFPSGEARNAGEKSRDEVAKEGKDKRFETGAAGGASDETPAAADPRQERPPRKIGDQKDEEGGEAVRREEQGRVLPKKGRGVLPGWGAPQARREHPEHLRATEGFAKDKEGSRPGGAGERVSSADPPPFSGAPRSGKGNFLPPQIARSRGRGRAKGDSALRFVYLGGETSAGGKDEIPRPWVSSLGETHSAWREGEDR